MDASNENQHPDEAIRNEGATIPDSETKNVATGGLATSSKASSSTLHLENDVHDEDLLTSSKEEATGLDLEGPERILLSYTTEDDSSIRGMSSNVSTMSEESYLRRRLKKHLRTGVPFYKIPQARYKWGQKQGHGHHVWGALFFDLAFVGIAFQLGTVVADGVKTHRIIESIGLFIALFAALEMCWQYKLSFDSRYHADDLFHRLYQICVGSIVSFSANAIAPLSVMESSSEHHALVFSSSMLAFHIIDTIPYFEMLRSDVEVVRNYGKVTLVHKTVPIAISAGSVVSAIYAPLWVSALLWFILGNWFKLYIFLISAFKIYGNDKFVPMHGMLC